MTNHYLARAKEAVGQTVEYLQGVLGPDAWTEGMHPEIPEKQVLDNPYTYKETAAWKTAEGTEDPA